ncbi:MAG: alpha/beta fold hydrolase [Actinobacteria bacterium]|nr:alpha/beta fold hydrolase [Actinomycetota bacterium]
MIDITSSTELPSNRETLTLETNDNLKLVAELATPVQNESKAVLLTLHPLPTHGGFMDSHILRKAANRLPALADLAVLRFNTRGTTSPQGTSEGSFGDGIDEERDLEAALGFLKSRNLGPVWLVGWSFGTELAIKYGFDKDIAGAILLSPPLRRSGEQDLVKWVGSGKRLIALIPEHDEYLAPAAALERFAVLPEAEVIPVDGAKHLWVGEPATKRVLNEIVRAVNPAKYPLPDTF